MPPRTKHDLLLMPGIPDDKIRISQSHDAPPPLPPHGGDTVDSQIILRRAKRLKECHSDHIREMIAVAAYYKAEKHGFCPERQVEDWLEAEKEIMAMLFQ